MGVFAHQEAARRDRHLARPDSGVGWQSWPSMPEGSRQALSFEKKRAPSMRARNNWLPEGDRCQGPNESTAATGGLGKSTALPACRATIRRTDAEKRLPSPSP